MALAQVIQISSRRPPAATEAVTLPAPGSQGDGNLSPERAISPTVNPAPGNVQPRGGELRFTAYRTTGGRLEFHTEWGRACRFQGRWYVGAPPRLVTVPATVAALDAAEARYP